jgi:DNA-binding response OmpR family regulator
MLVRVLLIDDDPEFREALKAVLQDAGIGVTIAVDGADAVRILEREHDSIDVAIVDLNLPEISGFEVIGAITRRQTAMGILATTALYKDTFLEVARHLGAHVALRKPSGPKELEAWVPAIRSILKAEGDMGLAAGALD